MKNSKPKAKRSHGLSRLRLELAQKRMYRTLRRELLELSARIAALEPEPQPELQ